MAATSKSARPGWTLYAAFLDKIRHPHFKYCQEEKDKKYGVLGTWHSNRLLHVWVKIINRGCKDPSPLKHTKGKDLSISADARSEGGDSGQLISSRQGQAYQPLHAARSACPGPTLLDTQQEDSVQHACEDVRPVYGHSRARSAVRCLQHLQGQQACPDHLQTGGTRDKGRRGDTLIFGNQEQIYKCAAFRISAAAPAGLNFHHSVEETVGK